MGHIAGADLSRSMDSDDKCVETSGVIMEESMGESSITGELKTIEIHSSVHSGDLGQALILKYQRKISDIIPFGTSLCTRQDVSIS